MPLSNTVSFQGYRRQHSAMISDQPHLTPHLPTASVPPLLSVERSSSLTNSENRGGAASAEEGPGPAAELEVKLSPRAEFHAAQSVHSHIPKQRGSSERTGHGSFSKLSDSGPLDVTKVALYLHHRRLLAHAGTDSMNQSDGIYSTYTPVAWELWQRKLSLSSGYALGLGSVYCHISQATGV